MRLININVWNSEHGAPIILSRSFLATSRFGQFVRSVLGLGEAAEIERVKSVLARETCQEAAYKVDGSLLGYLTYLVQPP